MLENPTVVLMCLTSFFLGLFIGHAIGKERGRIESDTEARRKEWLKRRNKK